MKGEVQGAKVQSMVNAFQTEKDLGDRFGILFHVQTSDIDRALTGDEKHSIAVLCLASCPKR